jgi:hypothetical protein
MKQIKDITNNDSLDINEKVAILLNLKPEVIIKRAHETGDWLYAVILNDDQEFWLDAFDDLDEAVNYVNKNGLKLGLILG